MCQFNRIKQSQVCDYKALKCMNQNGKIKGKTDNPIIVMILTVFSQNLIEQLDKNSAKIRSEQNYHHFNLIIIHRIHTKMAKYTFHSSMYSIFPYFIQLIFDKYLQVISWGKDTLCNK